PQIRGLLPRFGQALPTARLSFLMTLAVKEPRSARPAGAGACPQDWGRETAISESGPAQPNGREAHSWPGGRELVNTTPSGRSKGGRELVNTTVLLAIYFGQPILADLPGVRIYV